MGIALSFAAIDEADRVAASDIQFQKGLIRHPSSAICSHLCIDAICLEMCSMRSTPIRVNDQLTTDSSA